jgi:hypothetical protein
MNEEQNNISKTWAESYAEVSEMWVKSDFGPASAYPGKNKK